MSSQTQRPAFDAIVPKDHLLGWIKTFRSLVDEARMYVTEDGLYAVPVDAANHCMMEQTLHESAFESYQTTGMEIGVNLEGFEDYVKAGTDELTHLSFNEETRKIDIQCGSVELEMACIDSESVRNDATIPDLSERLTTDVSTEAGAFAHAVDVVAMVSTYVVLDSDPDADAPFRVRGEGDVDAANVAFRHSLLEGSTVSESSETMYSISYLQGFTKVMPKSAELRIRTGEELPIMLEYEHAEGYVDVRMVLAPRIVPR